MKNKHIEHGGFVWNGNGNGNGIVCNVNLLPILWQSVYPVLRGRALAVRLGYAHWPVAHDGFVAVVVAFSNYFVNFLTLSMNYA